jgi:hypothetical protein
MNPILRPVDPAKRLPQQITDNPMMKGVNASGPVLVTYVNGSISERFSAQILAYYMHDHKRWIGASDNIFDNKNNVVREWFEEITIESLFPDDDMAYNVASNAAGGTIYKIGLHQEGQTFFKNQLLKNLRK